MLHLYDGGVKGACERIHGHLGLNQMLKNVGFFDKNKAIHYKNGNVLHPQEHLVTWFSIYSVNNSL